MELLKQILFLFASSSIFTCFYCTSGTQQVKETPKYELLDAKIVYHDSIGDVGEAIVRLEQKINSVYDLIGTYSTNTDDSVYYDSILRKAKTSYKETILINSKLFELSYGRGTSASAGAALYYYIYLTRYYNNLVILKKQLAVDLD